MPALNFDSGSIIVSFSTLIGFIGFAITMSSKITREVVKREQLQREQAILKRELVKLEDAISGNTRVITDINLKLVEISTTLKNIERRLKD